MLKKVLLVPVLLGAFANVALADVSAVYRGTVASRQECRDNNRGTFSTDISCKKLALQNRDCAGGPERTRNHCRFRRCRAVLRFSLPR